MILIDVLYIIIAIASFCFVNGNFGDITSSSSFVAFQTSRIFTGIASGAGTAMAPTYLGEISPPLIRGTIGTANQLMICTGIVITNILGYKAILGGDDTWKWLMLSVAVLPGVQLLTLWSFPESPKWLLQNGYEEEAISSLQRLRNTQHVGIDFTLMKAAVDKQDTQPSSSVVGASVNEPLISGKKRSGKRKAIIKATIIASVLMIVQQWSGINSIFFYSNTFLENAGLNSSFQKWIGTCLIGLANALSVFIAVKLMDELGRKKLIYISGIGMTFASICISIVLFIYNHKNQSSVWAILTIVFMILYVATFEVGLGPIPWLMTAEITPSSHRGQIASLATFINWGAALVVAQFSPFVIDNVYYIPFVVVIVLGVVFMYLFVPETKGKSENVIQAELAE